MYCSVQAKYEDLYTVEQDGQKGSTGFEPETSRIRTENHTPTPAKNFL
jgi:hypothetical protein